MVQARRPEGVGRFAREALVLPEHDAGHERATLSREPGRHRVRDVRAQTVNDAEDPAPGADDAQMTRAEHDVDAVTLQICALVEAVPGAARSGDLGQNVHDGSLRRSAAKWEADENRLPQRRSVKASRLAGEAEIERRAPGRAGHDELDVAGMADLG